MISLSNPLVIGRLEVFWRPGSWCRPEEWVFARTLCDEGCFIADLGFFCVTLYRGEHTPSKVAAELSKAVVDARRKRQP